MMLSRFSISISRNFSCNVVKTSFSLPPFRHNFSKKEEAKILETINSGFVNQLTKYNLSKARAQKICIWKSKHGSFKEIQQMLEIDGFGEKIVQKFCSSIIETGDKIEVEAPQTTPKPSPININQYCTPPPTFEARSQIKSCLGVNVYSGGISWAKLTLHEDEPITLDAWSEHSFNANEKRMGLSDLVIATKEICEKMPIADAYVLEQPVAPQPALPGKNTLQANVNIQKAQLVGMTALGLLYKPQETLNVENQIHQVYFLRNFLAARLFRTKIGSERVSSEQSVFNLLNDHSQISSSNEVREIFEKGTSTQRDVLGYTLLTALTFVRLCVQACQKSLLQLNERKNP